MKNSGVIAERDEDFAMTITIDVAKLKVSNRIIRDV